MLSLKQNQYAFKTTMNFLNTIFPTYFPLGRIYWGKGVAGGGARKFSSENFPGFLL